MVVKCRSICHSSEIHLHYICLVKVKHSQVKKLNNNDDLNDNTNDQQHFESIQLVEAGEIAGSGVEL